MYLVTLIQHTVKVGHKEVIDSKFVRAFSTWAPFGKSGSFSCELSFFTIDVANSGLLDTYTTFIFFLINLLSLIFSSAPKRTVRCHQCDSRATVESEFKPRMMSGRYLAAVGDCAKETGRLITRTTDSRCATLYANGTDIPKPISCSSVKVRKSVDYRCADRKKLTS
jgi:hypothetical protein